MDSQEPCRLAKVPDGPHIYILNILWLQEKEVQMHYLSEARASHSQTMWAEVSSLTPHPLYSGLSDSPSR